MKLYEIKDPKTRARVEQALAAAGGLQADLRRDGSGPPSGPILDIKMPGKRIRQPAKTTLNKLESAALAFLQSEHPDGRFSAHALKLEIGSGCWYTPDIIGFYSEPPIKAYEIKGPKMWDDSIVKIKTAARMWKHIDFFLMWKEKDGSWMMQYVLP